MKSKNTRTVRYNQNLNKIETNPYEHLWNQMKSKRRWNEIEMIQKSRKKTQMKQWPANSKWPTRTCDQLESEQIQAKFQIQPADSLSSSDLQRPLPLRNLRASIDLGTAKYGFAQS